MQMVSVIMQMHVPVEFITQLFAIEIPEENLPNELHAIRMNWIIRDDKWLLHCTVSFGFSRRFLPETGEYNSNWDRRIERIVSIDRPTDECITQSAMRKRIQDISRIIAIYCGFRSINFHNFCIVFLFYFFVFRQFRVSPVWHVVSSYQFCAVCVCRLSQSCFVHNNRSRSNSNRSASQQVDFKLENTVFDTHYTLYGNKMSRPSARRALTVHVLVHWAHLMRNNSSQRTLIRRSFMNSHIFITGWFLSFSPLLARWRRLAI